MTEEHDDLGELTADIRKLIESNRKFLEGILDDEFETEENQSDDPEEEFEEL